jgi:hypothetical protein
VSNFFKGAALLVLISCGVWVAVLWRWEASAHDMNTRDIVVYLALLPLTVFALALMLRWAWRGAALRQAAAAATAATAGASAAQGGTTDASNADADRRHATMQLISAHLVCAAGASASELQAAAKDSAPRPALDPELRDEDGLPVLSARIEGLDLSALDALLDSALPSARALRPEWAELTANEHVLRALSALLTPLTQAVGALAPWGERFQLVPDAPRGQPPAKHVRVLLGWPEDWSAFEQELGLACVAELIKTTGDAPIPQACFVLTSLAGHGEALLTHADRLLQTMAREGHADPLIVAACHSTLSDAAIEALERQGELFTATKRPKGRMPGEAAAALVLADAAWPAAPDADSPLPHLHRPAVLMRDKSVDAPGRVSSEMATQAITHALMAARLGGDAVAALACDADQHSPRGAEFHSAAMALVTELDAVEDMRSLGTVTGAVGAVSTLLVVACAAERAQAADKPCLAVTVGDAFARLALVALPGPPRPAPTAAATATAATA